MNKILIHFFLFLNRLFPEKNHPFNKKKKGSLDLNYTDFEYDHTEKLLAMYSELINLDDLVGKQILDIGCGAGGKSIYIAEHFKSFVTGIDQNLHFLDQAINKAKEKKVQDKVTFIEGSALNMSFIDKEFDIIIMSDVIEHIPNTRVLFKEINRHLKKGGFIIFDFAPYYHYFGHHLWDTLRIPWLHLFTTESFRIKLYKESVKLLEDGNKRIKLRIGVNQNGKESFTYLNRISRSTFEKIIFENKDHYSFLNIDYKMLKNISIFSKIPFLREIFIRHILGIMKK